MEIIVDDKVYEKSKIHSTIIQKIVATMERTGVSCKKAKRKWQEVVDIDGCKYGVACHREDDTVVILQIRTLRKEPRPWNVQGA